MLRKLKTFWGSGSKGLLIKEKILSFFQYLKYCWRFGHFGRGTILYKPDRIIGKKQIHIGNNVSVMHHMRMEVISDWLGTKYNGAIKIGDRVSIGQNFHVTSASDLVIEEDTTILGNVFITNIDHKYDEAGVHILRQGIDVKETHIGANCFIGFGASIQAGTILGRNCIVGTNAVVRGTFEDYSVIAGVPAKVIKKYNAETGKWERV